MAKYFKFIGIIELILYVIGIIYYFIALVALGGMSSVLPGATKFMCVLVVICYIVFGPAIGLLFYQVGNLIDAHDRCPHYWADDEDTEDATESAN